MRLDFGVLWIDDQPGAMQSQLAGLKERLRARGFELRAEFLKSVPEARTKLRESVFTDHVDLILVDYDLGKGPNGSDAMHDIRRSLPYREMVFYSGRSTRDLKKIVYDADIEGVYCATRLDLLDVVGAVVESIVKRGLDLDHCRGIVLGATCDIDYLVIEALTLIESKLEPAAKDKLVAEIRCLVSGNLKELTERAQRLENGSTLEQALSLHDLVTSHDRLRLLTHQLKASGTHSEARKRIGMYTNDVLPKRNDVAHRKVQVLENGTRVLRSARGEEYTEERLQVLRRDLLDHREIFEKLLEALKGGGAAA